MAIGADAAVTQPGRGSPGVPGRRTMERPSSGLRTDLTVTAGSAWRSGEEESRRALTGGMAENAGVTWERVDAEDGVLRACPSVDRSATPRLLKKSGTAEASPVG